ncbi:MAG: hypothetical protein M0R80_02110 [Proteobacteria bacterium]|jgi:hypothetical protein|nr:hypothetical protein [Pseudomonadota bacterium]
MNFKLWIENDEEYDTFGDPKEWHIGQLGILDEFGLKDFAVIQVIRFEDVPQADPEYYKMKDRNTVISLNKFGGSTYKRGESVPVKIIQAFGSISKSHKVHFYVGAQNLYRTIDDLIKKEMKVLYPDLLIQFWNSPQYRALITEFPQLKIKNQSPLDQIQYQVYDIQGYTVYVIPEPRVLKRQAEYRASGYPHPLHAYYFAIPELKTRSQDEKTSQWLRTQKMGENGMFTSEREALTGAEKYINYLFYGE